MIFYASLHNLVNKTNLVHNLFLAHLSISTCFGRLWAHHQENELCFATLVMQGGMNSTLHTRQSSTENNKCQVSHKHSCFSWWWVLSRPKHVEIDKYTKNKLCIKLVLFTRLKINSTNEQIKIKFQTSFKNLVITLNDVKFVTVLNKTPGYEGR